MEDLNNANQDKSMGESTDGGAQCLQRQVSVSFAVGDESRWRARAAGYGVAEGTLGRVMGGEYEVGRFGSDCDWLMLLRDGEAIRRRGDHANLRRGLFAALSSHVELATKWSWDQDQWFRKMLKDLVVAMESIHPCGQVWGLDVHVAVARHLAPWEGGHEALVGVRSAPEVVAWGKLPERQVGAAGVKWVLPGKSKGFPLYMCDWNRRWCSGDGRIEYGQVVAATYHEEFISLFGTFGVGLREPVALRSG